MTDQERIENLEQENHALRETAREWKNAASKCRSGLASRIGFRKKVLGA